MIETAPTVPGSKAVAIAGRTYTSNNGSLPWCLRMVGNYCRFEVRYGDHYISNSEHVESTRERTELYVKDFGDFPFNTNVWLSLALRIPSVSAPPPAGGFMVIGQMHSTETPDPGDATGISPCFAQQINSDGSFNIITRADPVSPLPSNVGPVFRYTDAAFPRDTWVRLVYRLVFAKTGNGYLAAWRDGSSIFDAAIPIGYNQPSGPYFRFGIYRSPNPATTVIEYANVEVGTADLTARISTPLPLP